MRFGVLGVIVWALISSATPVFAADLAKATFAGGCFWCMEKPFDKLDGVQSTISGYVGGHKKNPSYRQVSAGRTGHTEAIQITYDPEVVSYRELLSVFWKNVDPFDGRGQFCDKGSQYRPGIFFHSESQKLAANESLLELRDGELKNALEEGEEIAVEITKASKFYDAEDYHQNYYKKNPVRYNYYRYRCGRDKRLNQVWGGTAK